MNNIKRFKLLTFITMLIYMSACNQLDPIDNVVAEVQSPVVSISAQESFAAILAAALKEKPDLRVFIKKEALKQFDRDYDVLVATVRDQEVSGDITFYEILKEYDKESQLDGILDSQPLLTIFVPNLPSFSAETWNPQKDEIPFVAVSKPSKGMVKYFAKEGSYEEDEKFLPAFPVVVVKTNERVVLDQGQFDGELNLGADISNNNGLNLRFASNQFDVALHQNEDEIGNRRTRTVDPKILAAFEKAKASDCICPHRDFIYYDIFEPEGKNEGAFDSRYGEAITAFTFENVAGIQTATDNWTEGNLELRIRAFFIGGSSTLTSLLKVVNVPADEVQTITTERRCRTIDFGFISYSRCTDVIVDRRPKRYVFNDPVDLVTWEMDQFGSKVKYSIQEFDPSATYTTTETHSTTKAGNFKFDATLGKKVKVGAGFGGSVSTTTTKSTTVTYTLGSEELGEAVLDWTDPVIVKESRPLSSLFRKVYDTYTISTGTVILSCETVRK